MLYSTKYSSMVGELTIVSNEESIVGLWIEGQKYFLNDVSEDIIERDDLPILKQAKNWLDRYFKGDSPNIQELSLEPKGNEFRRLVWNELCKIPYGEFTTYGEIANKIAEIKGKKSMSAQAVGGAIGHNPISIIIPCHRVIGKDGSLTGYAGGIDVKRKLLELEKINFKKGD